LAVWLSKFRLDCRSCSDEEKVLNGCNSDARYPGTWRLYDWTFSRCPLKVVTKQSSEYIEAYQWIQLGFLPNNTAWNDQTAKFLKAMRVIRSEVEKVKEHERKKK